QVMATVGEDFEDYRAWLEAKGVDTKLICVSIVSSVIASPKGEAISRYLEIASSPLCGSSQ
ncbi:MAG TPA: hypothetical protein VHP14_18200, partial [Anaerolineales bacterium]|nr:hypothetical protein [Anaerolineales bacterium]